MLTIEALSSETGGLGATLETEWVSGSGQTQIDAEMGTPRSLLVTAGTVIKASVEIPISSTTSQMFRLKTSITPQ